MRGEWRILYESTLKEQQMQNEMDANSTPKSNMSRKQERALEQACNLNYSSAMNILQSSGPPSKPSDDLYRKLQQLHPPEEPQPGCMDGSTLAIAAVARFAQLHARCNTGASGPTSCLKMRGQTVRRREHVAAAIAAAPRP